MTLTRIGLNDRGFAVGLVLLMALAFSGCVSVKESGTKVSSPPAPTSSVAFRSVPEDAEVFVDDQFRGTTPVTLHLAAGTHKVEMKRAGYQTWERELMVIAGNDTRVAATLQQK
jgi:PBP1b-binding outer membrane lipoprotein LpoB